MAAVGRVLLLVGVLAGFAAAGSLHIPLGAGWLVVAYIAVRLIVALGLVVHSPDEARIYAVASTGQEGAGDECARLARRPIVRLANAAGGLAWLVAIYTMVLKPL